MLRKFPRFEPAVPATAILADGLIPTVELYRQILERIDLPGRLSVLTGVDKYLARQRATQLNLQCLHVLVRTADGAAHAFVQHMRSVGLPYVYVIDDNFWLLDQEGLALHDYYHHPLVRRSLQGAIAGASVVLCHSEHFAVFLRHFNPRVEVVPAAFSFELLSGLPPAPTHDEVRVGVVANSSRAADLAMVLPAIEAVLASKPRVVFEFIGWTPPELRGRPGVRSFDGTSDYRAFLGLKVSRGWLLGLAPLRPNRFVEYKSNNKYREFGGCGIAALYSDSMVYRESVREGETGWLVADDPQAWVTALLRAIDDPAEARAVGRRAREDALANFSISHVAQRWQQALAPVVQQLSAQQGRLRLARLKSLLLGHTGEKVTCLITARGSRRPLMSCGSQYLRSRSFLLVVEPGNTVVAELVAPLAGPFRWSGILATFQQRLGGSLEVGYADKGGEFYTEKVDMCIMADNSTIAFRCPVRSAGRLRLRLLNRSTGNIALHALSDSGTTRFDATGYEFPMTFAV